MARIFVIICFYLFSFHSDAQELISHTKSHASPFIENRGQWDNDILFRSDLPGGRLDILGNKFRFGFLLHDDLENLHTLFHDRTQQGGALLENPVIHGHVYEMGFIQANNDLTVVGKNKQTLYHNYFLGNNKTKWAGNVPLFGSLHYLDLWKGIDLKIEEKNGNFEYDFIVKPGANVEMIKLEFNGQDEIDIIDGKLMITTSVNTVYENKPFAYQMIRGKIEQISCRFILDGNMVTFEFPDGFDPSQELIIDPELIFSTYSGSSAVNWGFTATYDDAGYYYGGGYVFDLGYPVTPGAFQTSFGGSPDIGITKYTPDGTQQVYATYIGGDSRDTPSSLIVDNQNNLLLFGSSTSTNFPVTDNAYDPVFSGISDIILVKFNEEGSDLIGSTYIGGSENDGFNTIVIDGPDLYYNYGDDSRGEVMLDDSGNIYVASVTESSNFPTTPGVMQENFQGGKDGCIFKMNDDLSELLWSTYVGGSSEDAGYSIKINGNLVVACGGTMSSNLPADPEVVHPAYSGNIDGFVVTLNKNDGTKNKLTYLGTGSYDQAYMVDIDTEGNIYVIGQSLGPYPVKGDVYTNPNSAQFIHKLTPELDSTIVSTVFGDGANNQVNISLTALLVDNCGRVYISGWGGGINQTLGNGTMFGLPVTADAIKSNTDGKDFYFIIFEKDLKDLLYATFFGGEASFGEHVDGGTSRFNKNGVIYQAICACGGGSIPTTPDAWSPYNNAECNLGSVVIDLSQDMVHGDFEILPDSKGCIPLTVDLVSNSNGVDFIWDFGDGSTQEITENSSYTYVNSGVFDIIFITIDSTSCNVADSTILQVEVFEILPDFNSEYYICDTDTITIDAGNPGNSFLWNTGDTTQTISVNQEGEYNVTIDNGFCSRIYSTVIYTYDAPNLMDQTNLCPGNKIQISALSNGTDFYWNTGDTTFFINVDSAGIYTNTYLDENGCQKSDSIVVKMIDETESFFTPNSFTPNGDGLNDSWKAIGGTDNEVKIQIYNRWGSLIWESNNLEDAWDGTYKGGAAQTGVYIYKIFFYSKCFNTRMMKTGSILLTR